MTKVKVKALQSFSHGNVDAHAGQTVAMNKGDADELTRLGFVVAAEVEAEEAEQLAEKQEPAVENKMEKPHANKGRKAAEKAD